jgi:hypothetical protein
MTKIMTQVEYLNMKKIILEKFQCILQLNYSFYDVLFSNFNIDITMNIFWVHIFSFSVYDKHRLVIISKVHNIESNLNFLKLIPKFNRIFNKFYCKCDNPNCPPNCAFTPKIDSPIQKILNPKTLLFFKYSKYRKIKTQEQNETMYRLWFHNSFNLQSHDGFIIFKHSSWNTKTNITITLVLFEQCSNFKTKEEKDKSKHNGFQLVLQLLKHSNFIEYQNRHWFTKLSTRP